MNVEIVFSGLCSFLNVNGLNETMTEPSVILVRTDHHMDMPGMSKSSRSGTSGYSVRQPKETKSKTSGKKHRHPKPAPPAAPKVEQGAMVEHVAFIAFNSLTTKVTADPVVPFEIAHEEASNFQMLRLDGVEIEIENDPPGTPNLPDDTYRTLVVRKDDYWPEVKNKWDRSFVPEPGSGKKPDRSSVIAYVRLGNGDITAGRICPFPWKFAKLDGTFFEKNFAEEVTYSNFPHTGDEVVLKLKDLQTGALVQTLRFSALPANHGTITIFVGNNMQEDIGFAVNRKQPGVREEGDHFKFLNRIADPKLAHRHGGPTPILGKRNRPIEGGANGGGGIGGGPCGPNNGNGAPPPP